MYQQKAHRARRCDSQKKSYVSAAETTKTPNDIQLRNNQFPSEFARRRKTRKILGRLWHKIIRNIWIDNRETSLTRVELLRNRKREENNCVRKWNFSCRKRNRCTRTSSNYGPATVWPAFRINNRKWHRYERLCSFSPQFGHFLNSITSTAVKNASPDMQTRPLTSNGFVVSIFLRSAFFSNKWKR